MASVNLQSHKRMFFMEITIVARIMLVITLNKMAVALNEEGPLLITFNNEYLDEITGVLNMKYQCKPIISSLLLVVDSRRYSTGPRRRNIAA